MAINIVFEFPPKESCIGCTRSIPYTLHMACTRTLQQLSAIIEILLEPQEVESTIAIIEIIPGEVESPLTLDNEDVALL